MEEITQNCIEVARSTIRENLNALERLAKEIFKSLKIGKGVARIEGQRVTEILMKDAKPF